MAYKCPQCSNTAPEMGNCPDCNVPLQEDTGKEGQTGGESVDSGSSATPAA